LNKKVSIIVPIYNCQQYLKECLDSIINQTYNNIEIILIDDGSTDNSIVMCKYYKKIDSRIILKSHTNRGLSITRNVGLKIATGEYIVFVDADDYIEKTYVEELYNAIEKGKNDMAVCGYTLIYHFSKYAVKKLFNEKKEDYSKKNNNIEEVIFLLEEKGMTNFVWNKIFKRDIIEKNNILFKKGFNPVEDIIFNFQYIKKINKIKIIDQSLYYYRKELKNSLSSRYASNLIEKADYVNKERNKFYMYYNLNKEKYNILYANKYLESIIYNIRNLNHKGYNLHKRRIGYYKNIIENKKIKEYIKITNTEDKYIKIFMVLFKMKSIFIFEITYKILFYMRNNFEYIYIKVRKKMK